MELSKNLSKNLRALRGNKSQAEFSEELGLATATRRDTLELIFNSLSISPQDLLSDTAQPLELDLLSRCLERIDWFLMLGPDEQQEYIQWLRHTADLFSRLAGHNGRQGE